MALEAPPEVFPVIRYRGLLADSAEAHHVFAVFLCGKDRERECSRVASQRRHRFRVGQQGLRVTKSAVREFAELLGRQWTGMLWHTRRVAHWS
jgi:hypothetical protein